MNIVDRCIVNNDDYVKELLLLQKLILFRRHDLYSEDEAPILNAILKGVETALDIMKESDNG